MALPARPSCARAPGEHARASNGDGNASGVDLGWLARIEHHLPSTPVVFYSGGKIPEVDEQKPLVVLPPPAYGQHVVRQRAGLHALSRLVREHRIGAPQLEEPLIQAL